MELGEKTANPPSAMVVGHKVVQALYWISGGGSNVVAGIPDQPATSSRISYLMNELVPWRPGNGRPLTASRTLSL